MPGRLWGVETVMKATKGRWYDDVLEVWRDRAGRVTAEPDVLEMHWLIEPQLGGAHLDGNAWHNGDNVAMLCRGSHLRHDGPRCHKRTRERHKDARRPLLAELVER
jgi:hypothetical protein